MYDELLNLFDDYSSKNLYADIIFINQVFIIMSKYHPVGKYLKQIFIHKKRCQYLPDKKTINISLNVIEKSINKLKPKLNKEDYVYLYNLMVLETIFHEMEHVYQEELKLSSDINLEKSLLVLTDPLLFIPELKNSNNNFITRLKIRFKLRKNYRYYHRNHDLAPIERMGNINTCSKMIELVKNYNQSNEGIDIFYTLISTLLSNQLLKGYKIIGDRTNNPTIDYLLGMKEPIVNDIILNTDYFNDISHPFETRVSCGLVLTSNEYDELSSRVRNIK